MASSPPASTRGNAATTTAKDNHEKIAVLAVDNSHAALKLVDFAKEHLTGYALHVVHVQPTHPNLMNHASSSDDLASMGQAAGGQQENSSEQAKHCQTFLMQQILPRFADGGSGNTKVPSKTAVIHIPNNTNTAIGKALVEYANEHNASFLVLARASKRPLTELFVGSVTSYATGHAKTPLVIL